MLENKIDTDLIIYGHGEKQIHCHNLFIKARCPELLDQQIDKVFPEDPKTKKCIPLTEFSHSAVEMFVMYLYCGEILPSFSNETITEMKRICHKYGVKQSDAFETYESSPREARHFSSASTQTNTDDVSQARNKFTDSKVNSNSITNCSSHQHRPISANGEEFSNQKVIKGDESLSQHESEYKENEISDQNEVQCEHNEVNTSVDIFESSDVEDVPEADLTMVYGVSLSKYVKSVCLPVDSKTTEMKASGMSKSSLPEKESTTETERETEFIGSTPKTEVPTEDKENSCGSFSAHGRRSSDKKVSSSQKKRSRSRSPTVTFADLSESDLDDAMFTCTQAVEIYEARERGEDIRELIEKANKKQRLSNEHDDTNSDNGSDKHGSLMCHETSTPLRGRSSRRFTSNDSSFRYKPNSSDNIFQTSGSVSDNNITIINNVNNVSQIKDLNSEKERTHYSHDLCINPIEAIIDQVTSQPKCDSKVDSWVDDSIFAQIPEQMLNLSHELDFVNEGAGAAIPSPSPIVIEKKKTKRGKKGSTKKQAKTGCTLISENAASEASLDLQVRPYLLDPGSDDEIGRKTREKNKTVNKYKTKRALSMSQDEPQKTPETTKLKKGQVGTPMLNYSTIDTPILKV